jgi:hypothetical protein
MKKLLFLLLLVPVIASAQPTQINGNQIRNGTVTPEKLSQGYVRKDNSTQETGYLNIQYGYFNAVYFQSSGTVNASTQLVIAGGDNIVMYSGASDISIQSAGDINLAAAGNVRVNNLRTDDPGSGPATVLLGRIVTGSDSKLYWEIASDGTVVYVPVLTSLP